MKAGILIAASVAAAFNTAVAKAEPPAPFIPLDQRPTIPLQTADGESHRLVNGNYILQTGRVPESDASSDYRIDFGRDDSLMHAIVTIRDSSYRDLLTLEKRDPRGFGALMYEKHWSHEERVQYEAVLATIVTDETVRIPGFEHYRTIAFGGYSGYIATGEGNVKANIRDVRLLNDLSSDIDRDSETIRFDCGVQSAIKIAIMQSLENKLLPVQGMDSRDYKKASSYFYADGTVSGPEFTTGQEIGYHAFIFTPAGNIVEATDNPSPDQLKADIDDNLKEIIGMSTPLYRTNDNSLEQYIRGRAVVLENGTIYDSLWRSMEDHNELRGESTVSATGNSTDMSAGEMLSRYEAGGYAVMDYRDQGFMVVYKPVPDGSYNVYFAQKENLGMPNEGFAFTTSSNYRPGNKAETFQLHYEDALTGQNYSISLKNLSWRGGHDADAPPPVAPASPPPTLSDLMQSFFAAAEGALYSIAGEIETFVESTATAFYHTIMNSAFHP